MGLVFGILAEGLGFAIGYAQDALLGLTTNHLLNATAGGLMLTAWTIALALAGVTLAARRDVS